MWTTEYRRPFYAAGGGGGSPAEEWFAGRLAEKPPYVVQCTGCRSNHWTGRSCDDQSCGKHQRLSSSRDTLGSGQEPSACLLSGPQAASSTIRSSPSATRSATRWWRRRPTLRRRHRSSCRKSPHFTPTSGYPCRGLGSHFLPGLSPSDKCECVVWLWAGSARR